MEAPAGRYIVSTLNTTAVELAHFLAAKYPQYTLNTDQYVLNLISVCTCTQCLLKH
jgi:hypothetical protein